MGPDPKQVSEEVAFIGETLAPFFLQDPQTGSAAPAFEAVASLDCSAAADDWPFGVKADIDSGLQTMHDSLLDGMTDDLIWEYRRLFIGPTPKAAPPWGSVYTDRECVIFGESALALQRWMGEQGIESHAGAGEPPDHIGLMLALMTWIVRERPEILVEFLREHLLTWASHFLDLLAEVAEHPFYKGLAIVSKASLEGIQSHFDISVNYPKFYR